VQKLSEFMTLPPGSQVFSRFDTVFPFVKLSAKNFLMRFRHYHDHAMRARQEGIQYIEYTTGVRTNLRTKSIASQEDVDNLIRIATMVEEKTGVTIRFNISFLRTEPAADLRAKAQITLEFLKRNPEYQKYFVGIDLLGPEHLDSALDKGLPVYSVFLAEELRGGIKVNRTQHAGEHGELKNPRDAMIMGAQRLGHGTQLWYRRDRNVDAAESLLAMEYARRNRVLIETNLSSNLRLNAVHSYHEQPWLILLRLGIPVALSTDNDGILNTSPAGECSLAVRHSNVTYWELKQTAYDSIKYSFAEEALKKQMLENLDDQFDQFESQQLWRQ
ncbi:MAG: hypothetical protein K2X47_12300, partial [Bdellovibrionales bacterium]|nr:hypothetical protein [Bdellovibrionales bacterium]